MTNTHPDTGIRYGVIAMNSIEPYTSDELWYGSGATDISFQGAHEEALAECSDRWRGHRGEAELAASEADPNMGDEERERFIEAWFEDNGIDSDEERFIQRELEMFSDLAEIDEPHIEGECEGVSYQITWLGGAPLLWILQGPTGFAERLCSPCVPNAADLDGGYTLDSERDPDVFEKGYECYCPPRDWLRKED